MTLQLISSLDDVKTVLRVWRHDYNHFRPPGSLGNLTQSEYGRKWSEGDLEASDSSLSSSTNGSTSQAAPRFL
jgi:hypothetical protein